jgi:hypothetical protein
MDIGSVEECLDYSISEILRGSQMFDFDRAIK